MADKYVPMHGCRFLGRGRVEGNTVEYHCEATCDEDCPKSTDKRRPDTRCVSGPYTVKIFDPREDY